MDSARADILAARAHLQQQGWVARRSEAFHHLPPPPLAQWLGNAHEETCAAPVLSGAGWTLHPLGSHAASGIHARWLDALAPAERAELFAGLPQPGDGEAAPFAWAQRALCRLGLRLRIGATPGKEREPVWLELRHQPRAQAEAPLLVLDVDPGVRCVLIEIHERQADGCGHQVAQNLHAHVRLGAGAELQHLRVVSPGDADSVAHHIHASLAAGAQYAQALVATSAGYHLQRNSIDLQGQGARACSAALVLAGGQQIDQQTYTRMQAMHSRSQVEALVLAQGRAHAVANAHTRIAPGCDEADVHQRLMGVPLSGNPRLILRPHLEILHDNVQAAHGATWGALPEDALFYARQRGLDEASARALIIEGMARALLERCLGGEEDGLLAQWLQGGWLARTIGAQLQTRAEVHHG
ncbi:MAG: SufD family Fe-S cluster assembly protein [Proteobacteria bacterium]|nr:SufD family Fe-S cluster assembly protein [Pseudomonadota bacterium]